MEDQLEHKIFSSFKEWFEHILLDKGKAYTNISGQLFPMQDSRISGQTYSSAFYQWVYDQSITGANIPTASGLGVPHVDYLNGRTIGSGVTGYVNFAIKDFNIYTTNRSDASIIFEDKLNLRPNPNSNPPVTGLAPYQIVVPCVLLTPSNLTINDYAYGGQVEERFHFRAMVITDNEFHKYGIGTLFMKQKLSVFPYFDDTPLNAYGDFKTGGYNYVEKARQYDTAERRVIVEDVMYSPIEDDQIKRIHPNLSFASIRFDCSFCTNLNRRTI